MSYSLTATGRKITMHLMNADSDLFIFYFCSKYEDDDSDDEEAAKRFEVDRVPR